MADAKIVNIKGVQWDLKDEVARNKIAELETKTTVKVTNKINNPNLIMNLVEINNEKFLQLHFNGILWSGKIAEAIATFNNDFGLVGAIRCMVGMDLADGTGRDTLAFDIEPSGNIRAYPQTSNQIVGMYKAGHVYGDAFIKVTY